MRPPSAQTNLIRPSVIALVLGASSVRPSFFVPRHKKVKVMFREAHGLDKAPLLDDAVPNGAIFQTVVGGREQKISTCRDVRHGADT